MPRQRNRSAVNLPKGVHRVVARGREYFYYQAGRGTEHAGPRIALPMLTFSFDTYWHDNYRRSGFYRDRDRYRDFARRDQDRDGIPNRFDRDRDGDGIRNNRDRDRDGDGVRNRNDLAPNNPRRD